MQAKTAKKINGGRDEVKERLILARKATEKTQQEFAKAIGFSQSGLSSLELSGRLQLQTALAIEAAHGVNHKWMLTGEGEMLKRESLNADEQKLLSGFRRARLKVKSAILMLLGDGQIESAAWDGVTDRRSKNRGSDGAIFLVERRGH